MEIKKEDGVLQIGADYKVDEVVGNVDLNFLHDALDCDIVEFCEAITGGVLIIDEEGKIKQKRINYRATMMYKYSYNFQGKPIDCIVGNAIYMPAETFRRWDRDGAEEDEPCE